MRYLCPPSLPMQAFLLQGEIGPEIVRFAAQHEEDAIVLVRRSRLEPGRGRVLREVIRRTPVQSCFSARVGASPIRLRGATLVTRRVDYSNPVPHAS